MRLYYFRISRTVIAGCVWLVCCLCPGHAQTAPDGKPQADNPETLYKEATDAFQVGDLKTAAEKLEKVIASSGKDAQLESVYFTLGAACFNLQQYSRAAKAFQSMVDLYPKAEKFNDAILAIGQAAYYSKDYDKSVKVLSRLEEIPAFRERALLYEGMALKDSRKNAEAAKVLEKLVASGIASAQGVNGALILASVYSAQGQPEKARKLIQEVQAKLALLENVTELNAVLIKLGDDLLSGKKPEEALVCYRMILSRGDVIAFQNQRIATGKKKIEENLAAAQANPTKVVELAQANNELRASVAKSTSMLEEFEKLPDFGPALLLRVATSYNAMGRKWEAVVAYEEFMQKFPTDAAREASLYGLITVYADLSRFAKLRAYGDQYLAEFKDGPNTDSVAYLIGITAIQVNELEAANEYFGRVLGEQKKANQYTEEMRFLLGNSRFMQQKYDEAAEDYGRYLKDFGKGQHCEESVYRLALCAFFAGKYESALKQVEDYLKKFPSGEFRADAAYRKAVSLFAAQQYDTVINECKAWQRQYGNSGQLAEVLALQADALAAKDDPGAVDAYLESYRRASSDDVIHYSLFAAQKLLQKQGRWDELGRIFTDFVQSYPSHPDFLAGIYWVGKAKAHEGKIEEAKEFIAGTIKKSIGDPDKEAVEQLIGQLAQLCARKKSRVRPDPSQTSGSEAAVTAAEPVPPDPLAELERLLCINEEAPTAKARILYAKAEIARLRRQHAEYQAFLKPIAENFKPEELSPMLLAVAGDYLLEQKNLARAELMFLRLKEKYPRCDMLDFACNGLSEIAYRKGDFNTALQGFTDAIEKVGASTKLLDVTVGKAKALLALGRLDEAKKEFEDIASRREWRGEATAQSVYSLGEISEKKNNLSEAIAYYQRVFVAYRRYLPWVARAYLRSGACFEQIGKTQEALNTYREMLRNDKLAAFPEAQAAQKRIETLNAGGAQ